MSGKSSKTTVVTIRLQNRTVAKIKRALNSPTDPYQSVNDYCAKNIERFVWRHDKSEKVKEKLVKESPYPPFVGITGTGV
jgi:hypothetical protein